MNAKIISFALWGSEPAYWEGAIQNIERAANLYPEWQVVIFIDKHSIEKANEVIKGLMNIIFNSKANVYVLDQPPSYIGMFWRFLPIFWQNVDAVIIRDCDSLITNREVDAVKDWLESKKAIHVMRDHPGHTEFIMGGMFGVIPYKTWFAFKPIRNIIMENRRGNIEGVYQMDQWFLSRYVYPLFVNDCCIHDAFFEDKAFPTKRVDNEYIGMPVFREYKSSLISLKEIEAFNLSIQKNNFSVRYSENIEGYIKNKDSLINRIKRVKSGEEEEYRYLNNYNKTGEIYIAIPWINGSYRDTFTLKL